VMHAPVHPVDHQMNPLARLVAAKPFVEHAADDALDAGRSARDGGPPPALRAPTPGAWS
jgi:hypothetical protein